jgi:hypothetical protein
MFSFIIQKYHIYSDEIKMFSLKSYIIQKYHIYSDEIKNIYDFIYCFTMLTLTGFISMKITHELFTYNMLWTGDFPFVIWPFSFFWGILMYFVLGTHYMLNRKN